MPVDIDDGTAEFINGHRVARLATADGDGRPSVIPVCFVFVDGVFYSPIDEKPKTVAARNLKRVRNIEVNPHVSLVIDDYSDDWNSLAFVMIGGLAEVIAPGAVKGGEHSRAVELLREKYPQYRSMSIDDRPMIKIVPDRIKQWRSR